MMILVWIITIIVATILLIKQDKLFNEQDKLVASTIDDNVLLERHNKAFRSQIKQLKQEVEDLKSVCDARERQLEQAREQQVDFDQFQRLRRRIFEVGILTHQILLEYGDLADLINIEVPYLSAAKIGMERREEREKLKEEVHKRPIVPPDQPWYDGTSYDNEDA